MSFPLNTMLIDDEALAISRLRRLLLPRADTFTIIGEARNGAEGLALVEAERPDLIFLDIEMPLLNGFEMLARLSYMPMVVFATAYDQYAIRAFEENSIDYLLKPVETERLDRTVSKIRSLVGSRVSGGLPNVANPYTDNLLSLLEQMKPKKELYSISVKTGEKIILLPLTDIAYFEAEEKYVFVATLDGQKYLTSYTLTNLCERLPDTFVRVSRSAVVNSHRIRECQKQFDGKFVLTLTDKKATRLITGTTYSEAIRQLLSL
ncbi:LytR/AlgR family response regulator transcription factor [Fibrella arboris]|uniref:LytR/AlgR family response regulator transcription factor n=1 Tax=Fibrella arboris TaxID=3242486 RepID=UPI0035208197